MYVTIQFTGKRPVGRSRPILTASGAPSRHPAGRLLFVRDDSLDFDKGNYGSSRYVSMEVGPARKTADSLPDTGDMHLCRQIRRVSAISAPNSESIFFITTCEMDEQDSERFLTQFDRASAFLSKQNGYLGFRLLKNQDAAAPLRFINIARWSSMVEFVAAFSSTDFKARIKGGYDHKSQIMVARRVSTRAERITRVHSPVPFGIQPGVQAI